MTSRAHRAPPAVNGSSCSRSQTSSSTSSLRGPRSSSDPRCRPASPALVDVPASPLTARITSLTLAASAAEPRTSLPMITKWTRSPNRRGTRRSVHAITASVVLPNPPAPCRPVTIPAVPPRRISALTTASSSAGRSITHSGTCAAASRGPEDRRGTASTAATAVTSKIGTLTRIAQETLRPSPSAIAPAATPALPRTADPASEAFRNPPIAAIYTGLPAARKNHGQKRPPLIPSSRSYQLVLHAFASSLFASRSSRRTADIARRGCSMR